MHCIIYVFLYKLLCFGRFCCDDQIKMTKMFFTKNLSNKEKNFQSSSLWFPLLENPGCSQVSKNYDTEGNSLSPYHPFLAVTAHREVKYRFTPCLPVV